MLQRLMKTIWPWALLLVIGWTNNTPVLAQSEVLTAGERAWLAVSPVLYLSPAPAYHPVAFFENTSPFSQRVWYVLLAGLGIACLGFLLVFGWNRSLTAQVKRRTAALRQELRERRQAEQRLRASEERFATMFRSSPNPLAITHFDDNNFLDVNDRWVQLSGYTKEELIGQGEREVALWENQEVRQRLVACIRQRQPVRDFEFSYLTKGGEQRTALLSAETIQLSNELCTLWTVQDFTDRKRAEEQLKVSEQQLHQLAGYLQTIREEERTAMAREIHDELGQALTAMKMDIMWLRGRLTEAPSATQERMSGLIELMNTTINTVRKLASQLRPGVLDDLGLAAALEWQAQDFQARTNITCEFIERSEIPELAPEQATAIFRICQESLTNVMRHAQATRVSIQLQVVQNLLILEIKDNGHGVTESEWTNPRSLGIMGMRERAYLLGGEFKLQGNVNEGTTVTAQIPLHRATAKGGAS